MQLILWRWLGVVLLALVLARRGIVRHWPVLRLHLGYLGIMGAVGFSVFNALFYIAAHNTTALNMGIVQGVIPVFVLIGVWLAYRTHITALQIVGVVVTLAGVFLITAEGQLARLLSLTFNRGDVMMIIACALYAGYTVWLSKKPDVDALTWFAMLACAALLAAIPLAGLEWAMGASQFPSAEGWGLILLVVLFPSFIAQIFFIRGVELIGPERSGVFVNLVPIIASILAVTVLGEVFRWYHATAIALVLGGIAISERFSAKT